MRIHFVLIGEGSSDNGLIPHLEKLCIEAGADEVSGTSPDFQRVSELIGSRIEAKIRATFLLEPGANLIFIHRDADSRNPNPRYKEIYLATRAASWTQPYVAVVPVQETEAWLLLDEGAIRQIAQRPSGRGALSLPRPKRVESVASPKEKLQRALISACELKGRRLERFKRNFSAHRQLLLQRLPIGGNLNQVLSWVRLRRDLERVIRRMRP
jgi:hypothetical protein